MKTTHHCSWSGRLWPKRVMWSYEVNRAIRPRARPPMDGSSRGDRARPRTAGVGSIPAESEGLGRHRLTPPGRCCWLARDRGGAVWGGIRLESPIEKCHPLSQGSASCWRRSRRSRHRPSPCSHRFRDGLGDPGRNCPSANRKPPWQPSLAGILPTPSLTPAAGRHTAP